MKTAEQFNKELSNLYSQLTDIYSDIETAIARLVKKYNLENVEFYIPYFYFKMKIQPGKIVLIDTITGDANYLEVVINKEDYIKVLEKIEEYINDKVLI